MHKHTLSLSVSRRALNWRASLGRLRASAAALAGLSALAVGTARAQQNDAWSTTPADGTFTGINWTVGTMTPGAATGTIAAGDSLYFGASSITTLNENEAAGFSIGGFTFNAGASAYTIAGNAFALTGGITNNSTALQTLNDAFTLAATQTFTTTAGGGNLALGGVISGAGGFTAAGAGTVTLNALNTFTGNTIVNGGTLVLGAGGATGTVQGTVTVNTGATLNLGVSDAVGYGASTSVTAVNVVGGTVTSTAGRNEGFVTSYNLTGGTVAAGSLFRFNVNNANVPGISSLASATTSTFAAGIDDYPNTGAAGNLPINVAAGTTASGIDLTISGVIQQSGGTAGLAGMTKTGSGTLNLSATNTYAGATNVNGGTLMLSAGGAAGTVRGTVNVGAGATLNLTAQDALGYTAGTQVAQLNVNGGTVNNAAPFTAGALNTGNNGYVTSFNLTGGTLTSSSGGGYNFNGLGNTTTSTTVTTAPSITSNASPTTSLINAPVIIRGGTLGLAVARGTAAVDLSISGTILANPTAGAVTGITKTGAGIMQVSGANTYTGTTAVNGGTLLVNNVVANPASTTTSGTGTSTVTVGDGNTLTGTLGGTGSILGATTVNAGSTLTGATVGTVGTLTLQGALTLTGGTYAVDISGATADRLNITGALTLTNANITFNGTPTAPSYVLATEASETGAFTGTAPSGYAFQFNQGGTELDLVAIPEPATWLAGGLLVGLVGFSRRRSLGAAFKAASGC